MPSPKSPQSHATCIETQVLVVGGGTSGVCAAIQAARLGAKTLLTEEHSWLGGMLTAAGVSATDGNHCLPSGLWEELRAYLRAHYGGVDALRTGWVSETQFEPHVGNRFFHERAAAEKNLRVIKGFWPVGVVLDERRVAAVDLQNEAGERILVHARVTIDATEYGDVMAMAGVPYRIGHDAASETGEPGASPEANDMIQDLTVVAILKDFGPGADKTIPEPPGYDPRNYDGCIAPVQDSEGGGTTKDWDKMLAYGRLPNGKFMINWPKAGNDYYVNPIEMSHEERIEALKPARAVTLGFVYYLQTVGGYRHLGLAEDEFPTPDHLGIIPYNRESRRMAGLITFRLQDIINPYSPAARSLYKTGVAVGDYPLDHHHKKNPRPIEEKFTPIPAFTVPYGSLVPREADGLLVAEHSLSVTHLVNGCTRLQPCVMLIGQAAGAAAAQCALRGIEPRAIDLRALQQALLDAKCLCMPFRDLAPDDLDFQPIQRVALAGVIEGEPIPNGWNDNRILIHPDREISRSEAAEALRRALGEREMFAEARAQLPKLEGKGPISHDELAGIVNALARKQEKAQESSKTKASKSAKISKISAKGEQPARVRDLARLIAAALDPFHRLPFELAPPQ